MNPWPGSLYIFPLFPCGRVDLLASLPGVRTASCPSWRTQSGVNNVAQIYSSKIGKRERERENSEKYLAYLGRHRHAGAGAGHDNRTENGCPISCVPASGWLRLRRRRRLFHQCVSSLFACQLQFDSFSIHYVRQSQMDPGRGPMPAA